MTTTTSPTTHTVALDIGGMTCASCAARITKRLNKLDGVEASVNYATEQATVTFTDDTSRRRPRRPGRSHRLHGNRPRTGADVHHGRSTLPPPTTRRSGRCATGSSAPPCSASRCCCCR